MQIFVKIVQDTPSTITLTVERYHTISFVKKLINSKQHIPVSRQELSFCGKLLAGDVPLCVCGVCAESTLQLRIRASAVCIPVHTPYSGLVSVNTRGCVDVRALKEEISRVLSVPVEKQILLFQQKEMRDDTLLEETPLLRVCLQCCPVQLVLEPHTAEGAKKDATVMWERRKEREKFKEECKCMERCEIHHSSQQMEYTQDALHS